MTNILTEARYCTGCHETKMPEEFGLKSSGPGGRAHRCKECNHKYLVSYRQRTRSTLLCDTCNLGISALERHPDRVLSYMKLALDD